MNQQASDLPMNQQADYLFTDTDSVETVNNPVAYLKPHKSGKFESSYGEGSLVASPEIQLLEIVPGERRSFYSGEYSEANVKQEAACFSNDGIEPSVLVKEPKSRNCINCPLNAWGSAKQYGVASISKNAKACKTHKRFIVLLNVPETHELYGVMHILSLTPTALDMAGRVLSRTAREHKSFLNGIYKLNHQSMVVQIEFAKLINRQQAETRRSMLPSIKELVESLLDKGERKSQELLSVVKEQPDAASPLALAHENNQEGVSEAVNAPWVIDAY